MIGWFSFLIHADPHSGGGKFRVLNLVSVICLRYRLC